MKTKLITFSKDFDLFFSIKTNLLYLKGVLGILVVKMPSYFLVSLDRNFYSFLFLRRFFFVSVFKHFSYLYRRLYFFNYVKLKIKGLGYRIKRVCNSLFYFFFGHTNFFYLHVPKNVIVRSRKKKLVMFSNNLADLKLILAHLLLLKKLSVYKIRGLIYPKQIILIKLKKKKV